MSTVTVLGTAGDDNWTIAQQVNLVLDGLGGVDTLYLGIQPRTAFDITLASDGGIHIDTISGASQPSFITLYNVEFAVFDNRRDVVDLRTYFAGSGSGTLLGTAGPDRLVVAATTNAVDGGSGTDTAVFAKPRAAYSVAASGAATIVGDGAQSVALTNVERVQFGDVSLALDVAGPAGQVAKTLGAVFGASAVGVSEYVGIGLGLLDGGAGYTGLMELALQARLGAGATSQQVVQLLWTNVVGTPPTPAESAPYVALLDSGALTPAALGVLAADTPQNAANIDLAGIASGGLVFV